MLLRLLYSRLMRRSTTQFGIIQSKFWLSEMRACSCVPLSMNSFSRRSFSFNNNDGSDKADKHPKALKFSKTPKFAQPLAVPEFWPHLPLLVTRHSPLFPYFNMLVEVNHLMLIDLIRRKVELKQPYVGVFMRKDSENELEYINDLNEVYDVGTFAEIHEFKDLGDHLRLVVVGHRRIVITGEIIEDVLPEKQAKEIFNETYKNAAFETIKASTENTAQQSLEKFEVDEMVEKPKSMEMSMVNMSPAEKIMKTQPVLMVEVENIKHEPCLQTLEVKALTDELIKTIRDLTKINEIYRETLQQLLIQGQRVIENPIYLCDLSASLSAATPEELQEIMMEKCIPQRMLLALALLKKELQFAILQLKIAREVEEKVEQKRRKFILFEKLKVIKKELGVEEDNRDGVIQKLKHKIVPKQVMCVIEEELNKLNYLENYSMEFNVIQNYLDWVTSLPWGITSTEILNLDQASEILNHDHYGMEDIKRRILEFIAVGNLKGSTQGKILCFYGPPGVGKTSIARSIANALNRKYFRISVGGMTDISVIKGHRRTYVGAMPGKIIQCLKTVKTENPLILIDEVDKIGKSPHGDPASAMLELFDPEQNCDFLDHYLDVPVDISRVLFICTANEIGSIPEPLRDRMELIEISGYVAEEKMQIARQYLIPQAMQDCGINNDQLKITDDGLSTLISNYCRESGVRNLQKNIEKIARKVAYKLVKKEGRDFIINANNLNNFLGNPIYLSDRIYKYTPPGVVMGLAWTSMGGASLYIEVARRKSFDNADDINQTQLGNIHITGNLGNVMKESAQIALTVARNFMAAVNKSNTFLETTELHLHLPEGAAPKDGPSAGISIVTALISLATNTPVRQNIAMTGEVSLTGNVLRVGGIKEKFIAAKRSGIDCIIIPEENQKDYAELPAFTTENIEVCFVSKYEDVYKIAFPDA